MTHLVTASDCLISNAWVCGKYLSTRSDEILAAVRQHVELTATSVGIGFALALPLAVAVHWWSRAEGAVLGLANVAYTIPSLALFALLVPFTGLSGTTVIVGLVLYTLVILVRNTLAGLQTVPEDTREAASGLGYGRIRLLLKVELPLAAPSIFAGLRLATVSTIALVTVGAIIDHGGLGNLIYDAIGSYFKAEVLTASVLCVALAVVADLLLLACQRMLTPWNAARYRAERKVGRGR